MNAEAPRAKAILDKDFVRLPSLRSSASSSLICVPSSIAHILPNRVRHRIPADRRVGRLADRLIAQVEDVRVVGIQGVGGRAWIAEEVDTAVRRPAAGLQVVVRDVEGVVIDRVRELDRELPRRADGLGPPGDGGLPERDVDRPSAHLGPLAG